MRLLELLAPAKNLSVGIAAIDCGADAVYIAGSSFGARKDAGNSVEDIARLCTYAHRYGARIFAAVNTLVYEHELPSVLELVRALQKAGVDALIVQDLSLLALAAQGEISVPLHASTQCAIRDAETARRYAEAGFSRLILERQLSLREIRRIREATAPSGVELEGFVHGALCVCYSGQCYLSEALCGRSANRGECVQACRSRYTLYDEFGKTLLKDKAVLSLKDLNLSARIGDLVAEGVTSFKIEGRLKNESYVRNVVTAYSQALDAFIAAHPGEYGRASFGRVETKFVPQLDKTFNRGYTQLYLDGKKGVAGAAAKAGGSDGGWASMEAPKGMGEYLGTVRSFGRNFVEIEGDVVPGLDGRASAVRFTVGDGFASLRLTPGDGLSFVAKDGSIEGFRVDTVQSPATSVRAAASAVVARVGCQPPTAIYKGARIFRNLDVAFEKQLASQPSKRTMGVEIRLAVQGNLPAEGLSHQDALPFSQETSQWQLIAAAVSDDGREAVIRRAIEAPVASNQARMQSLLQEQLSKNTGHYRCRFVPVSAAAVAAVVAPEDNPASVFQSGSSYIDASSTPVIALPLLSVATLNELRRQLCEQLDAQAVHVHPLHKAHPTGTIAASDFSYKANLSNSLAASSVCMPDGVMPSDGEARIPTVPLNAFELNHQPDAELMRTRYCVRHELGLCPFRQRGKAAQGRLSGTVPGGSPAPHGKTAAPLFLENNGRRFRLDFDCSRCEMTLKAL